MLCRSGARSATRGPSAASGGIHPRLQRGRRHPPLVGRGGPDRGEVLNDLREDRVTAARGGARKRDGNASIAPAGRPGRARLLGRRLRRWFRAHGRDLPWRRTRDPYHILVSELMLQQTQVSRVVDYYDRFLTRFPDAAPASPRRRRRTYSRLGRGSATTPARATCTPSPAAVTRDGSGGAPPRSCGAARAPRRRSLHRRCGRVVRLRAARRARGHQCGARAGACFRPQLHPKRPRDLTQLWRIAAAVLPRRGPTAWTHNQALMELGALVCTARVRHCTRCPVRTLCHTRAAELVAIGRARRKAS